MKSFNRKVRKETIVFKELTQRDTENHRETQRRTKLSTIQRTKNKKYKNRKFEYKHTYCSLHLENVDF